MSASAEIPGLVIDEENARNRSELQTILEFALTAASPPRVTRANSIINVTVAVKQLWSARPESPMTICTMSLPINEPIEGRDLTGEDLSSHVISRCAGKEYYTGPRGALRCRGMNPGNGDWQERCGFVTIPSLASGELYRFDRELDLTELVKQLPLGTLGDIECRFSERIRTPSSNIEWWNWGTLDADYAGKKLTCYPDPHVDDRDREEERLKLSPHVALPFDPWLDPEDKDGNEMIRLEVEWSQPLFIPFQEQDFAWMKPAGVDMPGPAIDEENGKNRTELQAIIEWSIAAPSPTLLGRKKPVIEVTVYARQKWSARPSSPLSICSSGTVIDEGSDLSRHVYSHCAGRSHFGGPSPALRCNYKQPDYEDWRKTRNFVTLPAMTTGKSYIIKKELDLGPLFEKLDPDTHGLVKIELQKRHYGNGYLPEWWNWGALDVEYISKTLTSHGDPKLNEQDREEERKKLSPDIALSYNNWMDWEDDDGNEMIYLEVGWGRPVFVTLAK